MAEEWFIKKFKSQKTLFLLFVFITILADIRFLQGRAYEAPGGSSGWMLILGCAYALATLVAFFAWLFLRSINDFKNFLVCCGALIFWLVLFKSTPFLTALGLEYRISHEARFEECKENAKEGYAICEHVDITELAINNEFRSIVYDPKDVLNQTGCPRSKEWQEIIGSLQSYAYDSSSSYSVRPIKHNFYVVLEYPGSRDICDR